MAADLFIFCQMCWTVSNLYQPCTMYTILPAFGMRWAYFVNLDGVFNFNILFSLLMNKNVLGGSHIAYCFKMHSISLTDTSHFSVLFKIHCFIYKVLRKKEDLSLSYEISSIMVGAEDWACLYRSATKKNILICLKSVFSFI